MTHITKKKILLADNVPTALETRASFLASKGYEVVPAGSPAEVESRLDEEHVHLAVLDIRLVNDDDDDDFSGIWIAQDPAYAPLPFIMLTAFPTAAGAKMALKKHLGHVPAVDYLAKADGLGALLKAVEDAFSEHVHLRWDLQINFNPASLLTMLAIATHIHPDDASRILLNRTEELQDLLRRIFYDCETLHIERLLWQRPGLLALATTALRDGRAPENLALVVGDREAARQEGRRFNDYTPGPRSGCTTSLKGNTIESLHFGANLYQLSGATPDRLFTLEEKFNREPWGTFKPILESVLETSLAAWNEQREAPAGAGTLDELYRQETLAGVENWEALLEERLQIIQRRASALDGHIERRAGQLGLWLGDRPLQLPNPLAAMKQGFALDLPAARVHAPGDLRGDTILVQEAGRAWLTYFSGAGLKPYLWNYQSLEAAMRYDWIGPDRLSQVVTLEEALVGNKFHAFSAPDYSLIDAELQPLVRAVQAVRRAAERLRGFREQAYHLGLFYLAMGRILSWQAGPGVTDQEMARLVHCLVSAALLARKLQESTADPPAKPSLQIEPQARRVYINSIERPVSGNGFEILMYLYQRRPGVVTHDEIFQQVYGFQPDSTSRNTVRKAVQRLRGDIEPDPENPIFILTVQGKGYRLDLKDR